MNEIKADYYRPARRILDAIPRFVRSISTYINNHISEAFPDSKLANEVAGYSEPEVIRTAYSQGGLLLEVAGDHLMAFIDTTSEPMTAFAPWTLARATLETGAQSAWLLDPLVNAEERAKRSFATRYDDLSQQVKFVDSAAPDSPSVDRLKERIEHVVVEARNLGMDEILNRNGERIGIGKLMPSATTMITDVFGDKNVYRLLSAMAHGHSWAIMWFGFKPSADDDKTSDYVKTTKFIPPQGMIYVSKWAVRAFAQPVWNKSCLCGWDLERLRAILEASYEDMGLLESERFWREPTGS